MKTAILAFSLILAFALSSLAYAETHTFIVGIAPGFCKRVSPEALFCQRAGEYKTQDVTLEVSRFESWSTSLRVEGLGEPYEFHVSLRVSKSKKTGKYLLRLAAANAETGTPRGESVTSLDQLENLSPFKLATGVVPVNAIPGEGYRAFMTVELKR